LCCGGREGWEGSAVVVGCAESHSGVSYGFLDVASSVCSCGVDEGRRFSYLQQFNLGRGSSPSGLLPTMSHWKELEFVESTTEIMSKV